MAAADKIVSGGIATYVVKVAGKAIPNEERINSIKIITSVNRVSTARIVLLDGDASTGKFNASSSSTFVPGGELTIEAGYDSKNALIFKGIITKQSIQVNQVVGSALTVECRDEAIKMIVGRKSLTYSKKKDSDIISTIIGNYSGLSADVTATTMVWPEQVQYYVTDWDFVLSRAEANGLIVTNLNGKVTVAKPDASTTAVLTVKYGDNLHAFNAALNSINQIGSAKASSWDFKTQAIINGQSSNTYAGPGNITSKKLSDVVGLSDFELQTTAPIELGSLTDWAKAQLVKSEYAKIQGEATIQGTNLVQCGKYITLAGLGDRMNGDHIVGGVRHDMSDGNWTTEIVIGLSNEWFTEDPDVMSPPAAGLLPGATGLFNGTVKKMFDDPDSQFRILVDVPLFDSNGEGLWARLVNFYSTNGAGAFFMPEVGDEVIIGFLNEDPRFPIILGSVYSSSKNKPFDGYAPAEKNPKKAIISKTGITVEFDDENKVLTAVTPSKNTLILSDKDKEVTLKDENNNSIVMSSGGIRIKSAKSITLEAGEDIIIKGTQGVKVASSEGDVETTGYNIKETANMQFTAKGSVTAQVQGGVELVLKGGMVRIN
jgi:Rhs element Vgr protein